MTIRAYVPFVLACAIALIIIQYWQNLPLPNVTLTVFNVDLVGTLPLLVLSASSLALCLIRGYKIILDRIPIMLIAGMTLSTTLILISVGIHIPLLIFSNGVDLSLPLILLLVLWMMYHQKRGFLETIVSSFAMVGAPLLAIDVFFLFLLPVSFQIPFGAAILGGLGIKDGLNMAIFCMLSMSIMLFIPDLFKKVKE